jgi:hypothetical protein
MAATKSEQHYIQHNYYDHSSDIPTSKDDFKVLQKYSQTSQVHYDPFSGINTPVSENCLEMNFTLKLHKLLENAEKDGLEDAISWKIHGRAFSVNNSEKFFMRLMPLYFHQTHLRSFFRQLNIYGFRRITKGYDKGAYYHELFLRGKPFLTSRILRQKVKGAKIRGQLSSEIEPDFYSMPYVMGSYSFPALAVATSPALVHDDLVLAKPSYQFPSFSFFPGDKSVNSTSFNHLLHSKIDLSEEARIADMKTTSLRTTQCKKSLQAEGDPDSFFFGSSLFENSESDLSFLDGEVLCTLQQEQEKTVELFKHKHAVENKIVLKDLFDDPVQHYSSQECKILYTLLQDISE